MDVYAYFKTILSAMFGLIIFALVGFIITRLKILKQDGLQVLSSLVINVTLPLFIFQRLISGFTFELYSDWWVFPLISLAITIFGFALGLLFIRIFKVSEKKEFLSLVMFQNSAYLPLAIVSALFPVWQAQVLFIYIFLFLLGFDLVLWSLGFQMFHKSFDVKHLLNIRKIFSPPVIANILSLVLVFFGINKFIPEVVIKPLKAIGDVTIPLAIIVLGGNLSGVNIRNSFSRDTLLVILAKLLVMPAAVLLFLRLVPIPKLMAFLVLLQAALPSATSLAIISRNHGLEDKLISHTILLTHIVSLITLPLFLLLFYLVLV